MPTWMTSLMGVRPGRLFCFGISIIEVKRFQCLSRSHSQQIAQSAIAFEEQRLGRKPLGNGPSWWRYAGITMHGVCLLRTNPRCNPISAATLQAFHQQLFQVCSDPLKRELERIHGAESLRTDNHKTTAAVQVLSNGTVVQVFVLAGDLLRKVGAEKVH